ncbi:hypothetical protein R3P38DRAFT_3306578 [Favolaschia claudopus]|uniref:Uncharacterized protein n=1 Tax=Favolaschia claudopus TaxID=2862362 RepID=A0AAW0DFL6_9AGAR
MAFASGNPGFRQSSKTPSTLRQIPPNSSSIAVPSPSPTRAACPGCPLSWESDTFWSTYPFHIHDVNSKYNPSYSFVSLSPPTIRSARCLQDCGTPGEPCTWCLTLPHDVEAVRDRAGLSYGQVRVEQRLHHDQLSEKIEKLKQQVNDMKLEKLNLSRSLASARGQIYEYKMIFQYLGTHAVPGIHRMFPNALKFGWGTKRFFDRLQEACSGDYVPRNYTQYEIDLAILLYELGGGSAVHAMNHSIFALPSRQTIEPYRREHRPKPCLSDVNVLTISQNISTMFGSHQDKEGKIRETPIKKCGHTLMFDETALHPSVEYMPSTDEMAGFCLEHVSELETLLVGKDTRSVEAAVAAVKDGKVHIAQEVTVGAIAHLSRDNYGAKPIFVGPSCKKGDWRRMLEILQSALEAWNNSPDGAAKHGDIWIVSSDGDYKRRIALFMLCMHSEIRPGNPLYSLICDLLGLNRRVGRNNLVMDMDYRHLFKRLCTLLCSWLGMLVNGVCVNRDMLVLWFERLVNHDWSEGSIESLLHPKDAQNVSRAVQLLLCVVEIQTIDKDDLDPSEEAEFEALCLLGKVFDSLLQPFINPGLSLSEQITSLVTFAHLACGLFLQNSTSFMSNQLYGDLQTMVKAAIMMVAQTQDLDPLLDVLICLLGDNPVETLFGRTRMKGGHNPNFGPIEFLIRVGSSMNMDDVYDHHPELEKKPRRLNLVRGRDADHVGPKQWRGDISAGSCDLKTCWEAAVNAAEEILRKHSVSEPKSFAEHFRKAADVDLLRPFGGKYPALSAENDRSLANSNVDTSINPVGQFDYRAALEQAQSIATSTEPHSIFATIDSDGHCCHKKAIVRTYFDMTQDIHSSHDRLLRVRGFTIGGKTWEREGVDGAIVSDSTHFSFGDLFATFICYNGTHLALALGRTTLIKRGLPGSKSPSISAIPLAELNLPNSPWTVCGQIFSLVPLEAHGLIEPIKLDDRRDATVSDLETVETIIGSVSERKKTWIFPNQTLLSVWMRLKDRIEKDETLHDKLPVFAGVQDGRFPYQAAPVEGE